MAIQTSPNPITGTFDNVCFYKRGNRYYVRTKSSLSGKSVKKNPRFANTMKSANQLAIASVLASKVYHTIPQANRNVSQYRKLTGMAKLMLKHGGETDAVLQYLINFIKNISGE